MRAEIHFGEPDGAVRRGNGGVNAGGLVGGEREARQFRGFGIQANHFVAAAVVGNPHIAVFIGRGAPGADALGAAEIIFHVNDVRGFFGDGPQRVFVLRKCERDPRAWANRDRTER